MCAVSRFHASVAWGAGRQRSTANLQTGNYRREHDEAMATRLILPRNVRSPHVAETLCDLDEEDVWNVHTFSLEINGKQDDWIPIQYSSRNEERSNFTVMPRMMTKKVSNERRGSSSAPVNIPDWSKILRGEFKRPDASRGFDLRHDDDDDQEGGAGGVVPPHELLARVRAASFSVHEGNGKTLKGRDLSRVRNAVWKKTGFQE